MATKEEVMEAMALFDKNKPEKVFDEISKTKMGLWAVLLYLKEKDSQASSKEISSALHVSSARMTVLLKKMEQEGLVIKEPSASDARAIEVSLSETGKAKIIQIQTSRYHCMEKILDEYSLEELQMLFAKLEKIHNIFQKELSTHENKEGTLC